MYSVMWSEHCSYKSSKVHLKQFGEKAPQLDALLVGMGENAGVVDVGQGYAVTFKVESHNHPSYVEPYQGAATGVGGIVRDILTMGARPVAVMDPLRFGPADAADTLRVLPGVVAGIGGYGNCLGLPNIGGELVFDPTYLGNPLVNALCVGRDAPRGHQARARLRARATSSSCSAPAPAATASAGCQRPRQRDVRRRRAGQAPQRPGGRPVHREGPHRGVPRDLRRGPGRRHPGPRRRGHLVRDVRAGLAPAPAGCASTSTGCRCATPPLAPEEILMSESQERMCAIVEPGQGRRVPRGLRQVGRRRDRHR